jgi:hypothetical protein
MAAVWTSQAGTTLAPINALSETLGGYRYHGRCADTLRYYYCKL